jgi:hypothetical protein
MSQRSGTLLIESSKGIARISFQRGRIACAWSPASLSVVKCLVDRGAVTEQQVAFADAQRKKSVPTPSLGRALLDAGVVSTQALREAVATKIEQTIFDLISWVSGTFRLVADEIEIDEELTFAPGEVLPDLDVDTQSILLEAVRLFDERNVAGASKTSNVAEAPAALAEASREDLSHLRLKQGRVHLVSNDQSLFAALSSGLAEIARVELMDLREAGSHVPGTTKPLVIVDRREGATEKGALRKIRQVHAQSSTVAIVGEASEMAAAFSEGAIAVAEPSYLVACCANLLRAQTIGDAGGETNLRSGLGRLRRALNELRTGLLSATVSLNLMSIVADSVERAVLFILQRNALVVLGAFGSNRDGQPLANSTRGLALPIDSESSTMRCLHRGHAFSVDYDGDKMPAELKALVDRPGSGRGVLFPVLGSRRAIGVIYADNGRRTGGIRDVELMELATAQVGLAFENELLRRQLSRFGSGERPIAVALKGIEENVEKNPARG